MKKNQWEIDFPDTPPNEKEPVYFWWSGSYCKVTQTSETIRFYFWDGYSESFNEVFVYPIINLSHKKTL